MAHTRSLSGFLFGRRPSLRGRDFAKHLLLLLLVFELAATPAIVTFASFVKDTEGGVGHWAEFLVFFVALLALSGAVLFGVGYWYLVVKRLRGMGLSGWSALFVVLPAKLALATIAAASGNALLAVIATVATELIMVFFPDTNRRRVLVMTATGSRSAAPSICEPDASRLFREIRHLP
jgi:uncharacterized membrane protein YhaH (DUF805 family)